VGVLCCLQAYLHALVASVAHVIALPAAFMGLLGCPVPAALSPARSGVAHGLLLVAVLALMSALPVATIYHYIRVQSAMKLYVVFNMAQVFERLFTSVGDDVLDALYTLLDAPAHGPDPAAGRAGRVQWWLRVGAHWVLALGYLLAHTALTLLQVVTLNVALNSQENALFVILTSNNFVELKSFVFKKYSHATLFQVVSNDVVERFQLLVTLLVLSLHNLSHLDLDMDTAAWLAHVGRLSLVLVVCEVCVDSTKHAFMVKFNRLPLYYSAFGLLLWKDAVMRLCGVRNHVPLSRRLGLAMDPLVVIAIGAYTASLSASSATLLARCAVTVAVLACCVSLKALLAVLVAGCASRTLKTHGGLDPYGIVDISNLDQPLKAVQTTKEHTTSSNQMTSAPVPSKETSAPLQRPYGATREVSTGSQHPSGSQSVPRTTGDSNSVIRTTQPLSTQLSVQQKKCLADDMQGFHSLNGGPGGPPGKAPDGFAPKVVPIDEVVRFGMYANKIPL
jgi:hypothetical protein